MNDYDVLLQGDLVNLDEFSQDLASSDHNGGDSTQVGPGPEISEKLSNFLDDSLYISIRDRVIRILPQHWVDRIVRIITFQIGQYKGSDIAKMCKLNGNQFDSLAEMALYVCDQALNVSGNQETSQRAARALTSMLHGKMTINLLLSNILQGVLFEKLQK